MTYNRERIKKPLGKIDLIYEDSKLRVTTENSTIIENGKKKDKLIFRIEVKYFNQCLHANISPQAALALSDAIYNSFPESVLDEIAALQKEQEQTKIAN